MCAFFKNKVEFQYQRLNMGSYVPRLHRITSGLTCHAPVSFGCEETLGADSRQAQDMMQSVHDLSTVRNAERLKSGLLTIEGEGFGGHVP